MRLDRSESGEGIVLYFGDRRGSRYVGVGLGFSGSEFRAGGSSWRFMHPYVTTGRLFSDHKARIYSFRLLLPLSLWNRIQDRRWRKANR